LLLLHRRRCRTGKGLKARVAQEPSVLIECLRAPFKAIFPAVQIAPLIELRITPHVIFRSQAWECGHLSPRLFWRRKASKLPASRRGVAITRGIGSVDNRKHVD
jgi:hypothetical protein